MTTGADPAVVGPYLAEALDDERWTQCTTSLIAGGKSNLTYVVASPAGEVVLRRPPLGHVLPTAHDMGREARVMAALRTTPVPVPDVLAVEPSDELLGQPFYVMSKVDGHVARTDLPAAYPPGPESRRSVGEGLVDVLVDLHAVDWPAIGLSGYGRPEGFVERQVRRWTSQWHAAKVEERPDLDALAADLAATVPVSPAPTIAHGDYRLDNCMLHLTEPGRVVAVLDWELSSIGDPLTDLGLMLVYWSEAGDGARRQALGVAAVTAQPGFPTRREVVERYAARSGRDVSTLPWYVSFGYFKLAVIVAGILMRVRGGSMVGEGFDGMESRLTPLVELGRAALADGSAALD